MPIVAPALGIGHQLEDGAGRIVDAVTDASLRSGGFYASAASILTGRVTDQATIFPDLAVPAIQDNANEAIHRFAA
jgi:hypothetical protein